MYNIQKQNKTLEDITNFVTIQYTKLLPCRIFSMGKNIDLVFTIFLTSHIKGHKRGIECEDQPYAKTSQGVHIMPKQYCR